MHVIVSTQDSRRWISGILLEARDAEALRASLPQDGRVQHGVQEVRPTQFPFFILETRSGFGFLDPLETAQFIAEMPDPKPEAEQILFAILSEYRPEVAGRDEMGRIQHVHLDSDHIAALRRSGPLSIAEPVLADNSTLPGQPLT
jgi:hypothetical protein